MVKKNIFLFTRALYNRDKKKLEELIPFVLQDKEIDRFLAYLTKDIRLQLAVYSLKKKGFAKVELTKRIKDAGLANHEYPITLAFNRSSTIHFQKLCTLQNELYNFLNKRRKQLIHKEELRYLCLQYVGENYE